MKIPRISEIDLARIAVQSTDEKKISLRALKFGRPPHTYNPMRSALGDILNIQPEMFYDAGDVTSWEQIESDIRRRSKTEVEAKFNLAVAKSLYDYCAKKDVKSYGRPSLPWSVGFGQNVSYWWNLYAVIDERATFIFPDPRLSKPLTRAAIKFVHSIMHERLRVGDEDFADARLCVAQFAKGETGARIIKFSEADDSQLFDAKELNLMIDETYALWIEILNERVEEVRQRPTGTNPMGF
jgi:hypothetical protein